MTEQFSLMETVTGGGTTESSFLGLGVTGEWETAPITLSDPIVFDVTLHVFNAADATRLGTVSLAYTVPAETTYDVYGG